MTKMKPHNHSHPTSSPFDLQTGGGPNFDLAWINTTARRKRTITPCSSLWLHLPIFGQILRKKCQE